MVSIRKTDASQLLSSPVTARGHRQPSRENVPELSARPWAGSSRDGWEGPGPLAPAHRAGSRTHWWKVRWALHRPCHEVTSCRAAGRMWVQLEFVSTQLGFTPGLVGTPCPGRHDNPRKDVSREGSHWGRDPERLSRERFRETAASAGDLRCPLLPGCGSGRKTGWGGRPGRPGAEPGREWGCGHGPRRVASPQGQLPSPQTSLSSFLCNETRPPRGLDTHSQGSKQPCLHSTPRRASSRSTPRRRRRAPPNRTQEHLPASLFLGPSVRGWGGGRRRAPSPVRAPPAPGPTSDGLGPRKAQPQSEGRAWGSKRRGMLGGGHHIHTCRGPWPGAGASGAHLDRPPGECLLHSQAHPRLRRQTPKQSGCPKPARP